MALVYSVRAPAFRTGVAGPRRGGDVTFFALSKTLCFLIYPLPCVIILLVLSAVARRRRPKAAAILLGIAVLGLWLLGTRPVADFLLAPLERPFEDYRAPPPVDAIVVLGGCLDLGRSGPGRWELNAGGDRLVRAVILAGEWPDAVLILSGGSGDLMDQSTREAPLLRELAVALGVPEGRIRVDAESRNTHENAVETKRILEREGLSSFVLITSAHHMRRALGCFRKVGLNATPLAVDFRSSRRGLDVLSLVPQSGHLSASTLAIKEWVGLVAYRLRGYL